MPGHSIKIFNITADTAVLALMAECGVKDLMLAQAARITAPRQRILMEHYNPLTGTTYFFIKFQNYPNPTDNGWLAFVTDATGKPIWNGPGKTLLMPGGNRKSAGCILTPRRCGTSK